MKAKNSATAFAPASMGNVGVGFDILGLAFEEPGDTVRAEPRPEPGAVLTAIHGDGGRLPLDSAKNSATVAANSVLQAINAPHGVNLVLHKNLPLASGLGSSAASAVAAAVAVNALFHVPLTLPNLLPACLDGEAAVSGYHPDNVGPSLLGGITLITGTSLREMQRLPVPDNLHCALVTPNVAVPTAEARAVLPQHITLKQMVHQTGGVARLVDALHRGDLEVVAAAMESDCVIEPARTHLMPLVAEMRAVAKSNGALALVISGAGPTLCAVCTSAAIAQQVADAMHARYQEAGYDSLARHTRVSVDGARVIETS